MRKQFVITTEKLFKKNKNSFLLLGDIGVFGFRNLLKYELLQGNIFLYLKLPRS